MTKTLKLCLGLLIMTACQKDNIQTPDSQNNSNENTLYNAAEWWYKSNLETDGKIKSFYLNQYTPDWSTIETITNSDGHELLNIKLVPKEVTTSDNTLTQMTITLNSEGKPLGVIKEYFGNPDVENTLFNMYSGNGELLVSGEYIKSTHSLRNITKMSATASSGAGCSINTDGGTTENVRNPGPCNDDGSDPGALPGQPLDEVIITEPGTPNPTLPDITIPSPKFPVDPHFPPIGTPPISKSAVSRFVMKTNDQTKYPRFTAMVKTLHDFVKNDRKVLDALIQWTGLSENEILSKIELGKGPEIVIKELSSGSEYAYFKGPENPNVVNINASWVRGLETANLKVTQQSTAFLLGVTLLHEFVHYSRFNNGLDRKYEYGIQFEKDAFGVIINKDNAGKYTYRMYKK